MSDFSVSLKADSRELLARSGGFLFGRADQDAEHFLFAHDDEILAIKLDFRAGILAEQDAVAFLHVERAYLAFFVDLALAGRNHFAFLRLLFRRVRDNDSTAGGFAFFNAPHQNAVMERGKFRHGCKLLSSVWFVSVDYFVGFVRG